MNGWRITGLVLLLGGLVVANGWLGGRVMGSLAGAGRSGELIRFESDSTPTLARFHGSGLRRSFGLETVIGEVSQMDDVVLNAGFSKALQLTVETNKGVLTAYLGPRWMVDFGSFELRPGDVVGMRGLPAVVAGREIFMVAEIKKGSQHLRIVNPTDLLAWKKLNESRLEQVLFTVWN